jgi:uncharacterized membrane protein YccF (DUF307 family)
MYTLANLLWFILGGFLVVLFYLLGGIVLCLTIVGIPFGVQLFKLAAFSMAPFGHNVEIGRFAGSLLGLIMNILWLVFGGFEVALTHLVLALLLGITIIGLPFARQHIKLAGLALVPFGSQIH